MAKTCLAVEIGGTKLQLAIGTPEGEILMRRRGSTAQHAVNGVVTGESILAWMKANIAPFLRDAERQGLCPSGIGVGFGGPIDTPRQTVLQSVQVPGWEGIALGQWYEQHYHLPTRIYNDSSAAGWGEYKLGAGRGTKNFFYTNMGTGVGGSLIIHGQLYDGQGYGGGEFGQVRIPDFTSSNPHADIKLEALCAGASVQARLRRSGYVPENSWLYDHCKGRTEELTGKDFGQAVEADDPWALQELDRVAKGMGIALSGLINLFFPDRIAIGGGFSLIGEKLIERIRQHTDARAFISAQGRYEIVQCELGEDIVLNGALLLAAQDIE